MVGREGYADVPGPVLGAAAADGHFVRGRRVVHDDQRDGRIVTRKRAEEEAVVLGFLAAGCVGVPGVENTAFEFPVWGEEEGALEAERAMLRGLRWVVDGEEKEEA